MVDDGRRGAFKEPSNRTNYIQGTIRRQ